MTLQELTELVRKSGTAATHQVVVEVDGRLLPIVRMDIVRGLVTQGPLLVLIPQEESS